jgi:hypothetical protein
MISPFVNFKLKPGISRSLTGAALLLSTATLINAGESKAALFECFLNNLSACGGQLGDKNFTGFSLSNLVGYTPSATDTLTITESDGVWTVETIFMPSLLAKSGKLNYNVAIVGTNFTFNETEVNVGGSTQTTRPTVVSTMTGIPAFTTTTGTAQTRTFTTKPSSIAVSQQFTAANRTLNSFTTTYTQNVPGPLPLLGAAAAFGFSRRLRSRIKTSAVA